MPEATLPAMEPDDGALIARWRNGDERAASALVARYARPVARFVASLGAGAETEELVQDTFVRAFASLHRFRADSSLRTWLFSIARNLVRDRVRGARRQPLAVSVQESDAATEHDALDELVAGETAARLRAALTRLSPMQREVFALRVSEGLSYREIADVVGSTEGAARVHYFHAVRAIKEILDE
jgi:RNA polymerase sigma-70 factor (ECF subfamily)